MTKKINLQRFFKLVCGASLNDTILVENLVYIFSLAGVDVIDLSASADVIFSARRGIEKAIRTGLRDYGTMRPSDQKTIKYQRSSPLLMASIQIDTDPHFRKIEIDHKKCDLCSACVKVCPTEAFALGAGYNLPLQLFIERCYGCGICPAYCHVDALTLIDTKPTPKETLEEMINLGVKAIEFHFGKGYLKLKDIWADIKPLVEKLELVSFSIGSDLLSEEEIKEATLLCYELAGKDIIIQCDGTPMSGSNKKSKNGNNTDINSLKVAKIIQELNLPVYLQISGGTDENSFSRAKDLGLNINGVAIGSYARKLIMPYLDKLDDEKSLLSAINLAKSLVNSVK